MPPFFAVLGKGSPPLTPPCSLVQAFCKEGHHLCSCLVVLLRPVNLALVGRKNCCGRDESQIRRHPPSLSVGSPSKISVQVQQDPTFCHHFLSLALCTPATVASLLSLTPA